MGCSRKEVVEEAQVTKGYCADFPQEKHICPLQDQNVAEEQKSRNDVWDQINGPSHPISCLT